LECSPLSSLGSRFTKRPLTRCSTMSKGRG
jgi:hypothetical protein